jgi:hypothetical protein
LRTLINISFSKVNEILDFCTRSISQALITFGVPASRLQFILLFTSTLMPALMNPGLTNYHFLLFSKAPVVYSTPFNTYLLICYLQLSHIYESFLFSRNVQIIYGRYCYGVTKIASFNYLLYGSNCVEIWQKK